MVTTNMAKQGKKSTPQEAEAGRKNLEKWKNENPSGARLTHGAHSKVIKQKYNDGRYKETKQLNSVMQGLKNELGGESVITPPQRLLLNNIRSKLIVLFQISAYVDKQDSIINDQGELLPCLGRNYTVYSESLRRDLEILFSIKRRKAHQSYEKALKAIQGGKA